MNSTDSLARPILSEAAVYTMRTRVSSLRLSGKMPIQKAGPGVGLGCLNRMEHSRIDDGIPVVHCSLNLSS